MHLLAPKEKGRLLGDQGEEEKEEVASMEVPCWVIKVEEKEDAGSSREGGEGGGCFYAGSSREGGGGVYPYEEEEWQ